MPQVIWTPVAESDLDDILFYIAFIDRRPSTGERRLYFGIRDRVTQCAQQGLSGHHHPDAPAGWQYLKHKRWLIFFQPSFEGIEAMRVVDSARDLPGHLRGFLNLPLTTGISPPALASSTLAALPV